MQYCEYVLGFSHACNRRELSQWKTPKYFGQQPCVELHISHNASQLAKSQKVAPVNQDDGNNGGSNIDGTDNGSAEQSSLLALAKHSKELGGVEHDGVDSGELLKERDQH